MKRQKTTPQTNKSRCNLRILKHIQAKTIVVRFRWVLQRRGEELKIFCKISSEITKKTELGKECQIAHGSPRSDEETKAFTEKLQMLWWVRDVVLNSTCLKMFSSNSDKSLQWCMENVKWLQYWNKGVVMFLKKENGKREDLDVGKCSFWVVFFFS